MENEHFYKTSIPIPKSLNECTAPYPTTENLYRWANRLKIWGDVLCCILSICGIFNVLSATATIAEVDKEASFITFLTSIMPWVLHVIIVYCIFRVLALLFEALATTVQCRVITTKVALLEACKKAAASAQDASNTSST